MDPSTTKPILLPCDRVDSPLPGLRRVVRNSALLNVVIVLASFPVLVMAGGPNALVPSLVILAGVTVNIWVLTFTLCSFARLHRIFRTPVSSQVWVDPASSPGDAVVTDRWLDGPV